MSKRLFSILLERIRESGPAYQASFNLQEHKPRIAPKEKAPIAILLEPHHTRLKINRQPPGAATAQHLLPDVLH